jgi:hypothetical protein
MRERLYLGTGKQYSVLFKVLEQEYYKPDRPSMRRKQPYLTMSDKRCLEFL